MIEQKDGLPLASLLSMRPGAIAGAIATVPMTLFMLLAQRALPANQQHALPPEAITEEVAKRTDTDKQLDKPGLLGISLTSHLGYGASMGLMYTTFTKKIPLPPVVKGALFGLIIWAGSYLGWLPLGRFPQAAINETAPRNALMIGAHIIWGAVTGLLVNKLQDIF